MHYFSLDNWDPVTLCITAPGFGGGPGLPTATPRGGRARGWADCAFSKQEGEEMRGGREVGRQRKTHLIGHLSVGLGRSLKNNGNHFRVNNATLSMCQFSRTRRKKRCQLLNTFIKGCLFNLLIFPTIFLFWTCRKKWMNLSKQEGSIRVPTYWKVK